MTSWPSPRLARSRVLLRLLVLSLLVLPALAYAQIDPPPNTSTIPTRILLVDVDAAGVPDPAGECYVTVRDFANDPVAGVDVAIDLSNCTDLRVAAQQPFPGVTAQCATRTVHAMTDADGKAVFRIVGGSGAASGAPGVAFKSGRIYADGVLLGNVTIAATDRIGFDGLNANDLSSWLVDFFSGQPLDRIDYDGSGLIGVNDLSEWLKFYFGGGSPRGAASLPGGLCP